MPWTPFTKLKALEIEEARVQARRERERAIRRGWERLVQWERSLSRRTRDLARLLAACGTLYGLLRTPVEWVVRLYRARTVDRAELPKTGVASTAEDYIKDPRK